MQIQQYTLKKSVKKGYKKGTFRVWDPQMTTSELRVASEISMSGYRCQDGQMGVSRFGPNLGPNRPQPSPPIYLSIYYLYTLLPDLVGYRCIYIHIHYTCCIHMYTLCFNMFTYTSDMSSWHRYPDIVILTSISWHVILTSISWHLPLIILRGILMYIWYVYIHYISWYIQYHR